MQPIKPSNSLPDLVNVKQRSTDYREELNKLKEKTEFLSMMTSLLEQCDALDVAKLLKYSSFGRMTGISLQECCQKCPDLAEKILTTAENFFDKPPLSSEFYLAGAEAELLSKVFKFGINEDEDKTRAKVEELKSLISDLTPTNIFPRDVWKEIMMHVPDRRNLAGTSSELRAIAKEIRKEMTLNLSKITSTNTSEFIEYLKNLSGSINIKIIANSSTSLDTRLFKAICAKLTTNKKITAIQLDLSSSFLHRIPAAEIAKLTNLTELNLRSQKLRDADVAEIAKLTNLTHLDLNTTKLTNAGAAEIAKLTNLTHLDISFKLFSYSAAEEIAKLTKLTQLSISTNQISAAAPAQIARLRNLTRLNLSRIELYFAGFAQIAELPNLTHLDLRATKLTNAGAAEIAKLTKLTHLDIRWNDDLSEEGLAEIAKLPIAKIIM